MRAFGAQSVYEKAHSLQRLMGALQIPAYPPLPRIVQDRLRQTDKPLPVELEAARRALAVLSARAFATVFEETLNPLRISEGFGLTTFGPMGGTTFAYGAALVDQRAPEPEFLRHFEKEGHVGKEAVFMARLFNNILERMGEPERTDLEVSVMGSGCAAERRRQGMQSRTDEARDQPGQRGVEQQARPQREVPKFLLRKGEDET